MSSFARIFKRSQDLSRLGLSLCSSSNKLHKSDVNIMRDIKQASVNGGYYKSGIIRLDGFASPHGFERIRAPQNWPSVPIVPIKSCALIPSYYRTDFRVTDRSLINVINIKMAQNEPYIGMFLVKDKKNESKTVKSMDDIHSIGTFTRIYQLKDHGDFLDIGVVGDRRISITNLRNFEKEEGLRPNYKGEVLFADIKNVTHDDFHYTDEMKELVAEVMKTIYDIVKLDSKHGGCILWEVEFCKEYYEDPIHLSDFSALITSDSAEPIELQKALEERNIHKRLRLGHALLKKDFEWRSKTPENRATSFLDLPQISY